MSTSVSTQSRHPERNTSCTVYISQLDQKVTESLLWELMTQVGRVRHIHIPRNRITGSHFGFGFCEFHTPLDALYSLKVLNLTPLFSKPIRLTRSTQDRRQLDVGANLFVGNLVEQVDEKLLHDAFSAFGPLIEAPNIVRGEKKDRGYGFVKFGRFEHADAAVKMMHGQYICNTPIVVQYAFKKDSDGQERHGSPAERMLAEKSRHLRQRDETEQLLMPHTMFADAPVQAVPMQQTPAPMPMQYPQSYHMTAYPQQAYHNFAHAGWNRNNAQPPPSFATPVHDEQAPPMPRSS